LNEAKKTYGPNMAIAVNSLGVIRVQARTKKLALVFFGRYVGDLNVGIVHRNLPYDTMHKSLAFH
jgi:hypothetical protein